MNIKDSKFYRPTNILVTEDDEESIKIADKHLLVSYGRPYTSILGELMPSISLRNEVLLIQKDKLKQLDKCTDFYVVDYSSKLNELYEAEECYYHHELELFFIVGRNLSNKYDGQIFEEGLYKVKSVYYDSTNPKAKENLSKFFSDYLEKYVSKESKVSILLNSADGLDLHTHTIKPYSIDFQTMYNDDFIEVHHRVKNALTNESKGVVLFHGIAGSGKTNYIKWLTSQIPNKKFIFVPTSVIGSLTDPSFMGLLIENNNSVLVLEDCENYIAERTAQNNNTDVVSSILNIADGFLSDVIECQLICTFNSDISKIDPALLRKGRLIAEYKFKELSVDKCNSYLRSTDRDFTVDKPYSLAELTNIDVKELKEQQKEIKIGFK